MKQRNHKIPGQARQAQTMKVTQDDMEQLRKAKEITKTYVQPEVARTITFSALIGLCARWFQLSVLKGVVACSEPELLGNIARHLQTRTELIATYLEKGGAEPALIEGVRKLMEKPMPEAIRDTNRAHPIYGGMRPGETNEQADRETQA